MVLNLSEMDLIQQYSSSSSDSDVENQVQTSSSKSILRKRKRPEALNAQVIVASSPTDHTFTRQKPHTIGNWACHIYIPLDIKSATSKSSYDARMAYFRNQIYSFQTELLSELTKSTSKYSDYEPSSVLLVPHLHMQEKDSDDWEEDENDSKSSNSSTIITEGYCESTHLHISLSKPFYLQKQSVDSFLGDLKQRIKKTQMQFTLEISNTLEILHNDDCSRSFLTVPIHSSTSSHRDNTGNLLDSINTIVDKYGGGKYYTTPKFHVSIASWIYQPSIVEQMQESLNRLYSSRQNNSMLDMILLVRDICCDIGTTEKHVISFNSVS